MCTKAERTARRNRLISNHCWGFQLFLLQKLTEVDVKSARIYSSSKLSDFVDKIMWILGLYWFTSVFLNCGGFVLHQNNFFSPWLQQRAFMEGECKENIFVSNLPRSMWGSLAHEVAQGFHSVLIQKNLLLIKDLRNTAG